MAVRPWKAWVLPGGLLLAIAAAIVNSPLFPQVLPFISFYYFAVFTSGLLLAWRFNSSRVLFCLGLLWLSQRAIEFFAANHGIAAGPGLIAWTAIAILLPLNFVALESMKERGLVIAGFAPRLTLLFFESVLVAVLCRPETMPSSNWSHVAAWSGTIIVAGAVFFAVRYWQTGKPLEMGYGWSLAAVLVWLYSKPIGKTADAYVATAALILVMAVIETSYVLAYHDELTGIPGRRAFNEALLSLEQTYAIAVVDIDHFKNFNDTYGHDVGDQVLRMVASRLSAVEGGGQAFRCGGEEFAIVFRNAAAKDVAGVLDRLRTTIQNSSFHLRGQERRAAPRAPDAERRKGPGRKGRKAPLPAADQDLRVTVSMGVAEPSTVNRQPEQVIKAADQALYRAKQNGRNRVELASKSAERSARARRSNAQAD